MGKTVFDLYKDKINIFLHISLFLAFKKIKEYISPCPRLEKRFKLFFKADIRVTFQIFWGPATKERGNIETWNFGIGVQQQVGTT